jgi:hypothetical protein
MYFLEERSVNLATTLQTGDLCLKLRQVFRVDRSLTELEPA